MRFSAKEQTPKQLLVSLLRHYTVRTLVPSYGWTASNVNGGTAKQTPFYVGVNTGAQVDSRGMYFCLAEGMNRNNIDSLMMDFEVEMEILLRFWVETSDPNFRRRFQIKANPTDPAEGAIASKGWGLEINNMDVIGESYNSARAVTGVIATMGDRRNKTFSIIHRANKCVEFWADNQFKEKITSQVPSGDSGMNMYMIVSAINGSSPLASTFALIDCWLIQKRE